MKHILKAEQFTDTKELEKLFKLADRMQAADDKGKIPQTLAGKIVATLFFEPSTRTRLSFEAAALKLGAGVISAENAMESTKAARGEPLEDIIRVVNQYADAVVFRHSKEGSAEAAAKVSDIPLINAGDGANEHPTQALNDLYTIKRETGRLDNLHVALACDPKHSRTIRSLALLLSLYRGNKLTFISPESLRAAPDFLEKLKQRGIQLTETADLKSGLDADVLYMNRLQEERFAEKNEFEKYRRALILTADMLKDKDVVVLDPLPRIDEIAMEVDSLPNAKYFAQVKNGLYLRMALLQEILS
ncbi:MAG: aspartate carbamoyltransferase [Candidatus Doudnabacteria bacterium RIFCSPHIGHO2_01_FULL_46_14]|uniref:Aspartate carbamoyltransferase n=1 Tax=Candidatus Doudnabacteria bacterium RIFCSPHIGHO2_01_FULL_46_14 TaxID=1817824 RepID=A0A1F5NMU5_9BACT|nr:MAG: aspartate carbamoyltransferase [Candidatus Doudnabacteria bacterium RIFCSPHIGHO2_01_FULL_46_14]